MITVTAGVKSFTVSFNPSHELDVSGYLIHAVHQSQLDLPSDFTPAITNQINNGPETSFYAHAPVAGIWYVKIAAYDTFEDLDNIQYSGLNYCSAIPVQVLDDGIVLPPEFYDDIRTDFIVDGLRMYFGTAPYNAAYVNRLYWNGEGVGRIIRGSVSYAITGSGYFDNANGMYIKASLDKASSTASIMTPVPLDAGVPALVDDDTHTEIVIALTSRTPPSPGSNNVCYVRQSNSMSIEAAMIRNLEVQADAIIHGTLVVGGSNGVAIISSTTDSTTGQPTFRVGADGKLLCHGASVYGDLHMGPGSTLSWSNITDAPALDAGGGIDPTAYMDKSTFVTQIGADYVFTGMVAANKIYGNTIAGKTVQSTSYVPGVSGWSANLDGSAEFNNITARGTIEATSIKADRIAVKTLNIENNAVTIPASGTGVYTASCDLVLPVLPGDPSFNVLVLATTVNWGNDAFMNVVYNGTDLLAMAPVVYGPVTQTVLKQGLKAGTHTFTVNGIAGKCNPATITAMAVLR